MPGESDITLEERKSETSEPRPAWRPMYTPPYRCFSDMQSPSQARSSASKQRDEDPPHPDQSGLGRLEPSSKKARGLVSPVLTDQAP